MKSVAFIAALTFVAAFGVGFGVLAERAFADFSGDAAVAAITFIGTTWFAIWSFNKTKRKEVEAQIFPQKAAIYKELVDIIRDITFAQKGWIPPLDPDALARRFAEARFNLIVWGGQETIRAIDKFEADQTAGPGRMFAAVANLYGCIRRELGHADDADLREDLFLAQITTEDRESVRQQMRSS